MDYMTELTAIAKLNFKQKTIDYLSKKADAMHLPFYSNFYNDKNQHFPRISSYLCTRA